MSDKLYRIPELKWEYGDSIYSAITNRGEYAIIFPGENDNYPEKYNWCIVASYTSGEPCDTLEAAKAAAQQHFNAKMAEGLEEVSLDNAVQLKMSQMTAIPHNLTGDYKRDLKKIEKYFDELEKQLDK